MRSTYLFLTLVAAVLILPNTVFAQPGNGLDPQLVQELIENDERIEQFAENYWEEHYADEYDSNNLETSEEECADEPEEEPTSADETWDSFEENTLGTLSDSQSKKTRRHKDRAAQRKFKHANQIKHVNAEQKAYGHPEEAKVEEQDEKAYVDGAIYMQKDKPEVLNDHRVCKQKRKICKEPRSEKPKPQVRKQRVVKKPVLVVQPVEPAWRHFHFDGGGSFPQ